jgi:transposase-like protein
MSFTGKQEAVALALASGRTVAEVVTTCGSSERTIRRWLAQDDFRRQVAELRAEMLRRALGKLADAAVEAVDTLRGLLSAEGESARLGAARVILEQGVKLRESTDLEARLAALEERLAAAGGKEK